ncbi:PAP2 superfamily protein [Spirosomataceae bacterium TFI 002]|nr:PAP2 superfamily protein [Spirosomataceae bacterium TFI 002]
MKTAFLKIAILLFFPLMSFAQKDIGQFSHELASKWFQLEVEMVPNTEGFTPPVTARVFGYSGLTLYESMVHGSTKYKSLVGTINDFEKMPKPSSGKTYNWMVVANTAQAEIVRLLFANANDKYTNEIDQLESTLNKKYTATSSSDELKRSQKFGKDIANAIFDYSKSDGGHEAYKHNFPKDFKLAPGSCMWVPVGQQKALQPYWGENRTFVKGNADFDMPPPPRCEIGNSSILYVQALEVYSVSKNLNEEQKAIAEFWSDDPGKTFTPPGHGVSIANQLVINEDLPFDKAAEVYCRVGMAAHDAFISCWKCKYKYNLLRPVTFIQTSIDPSWKAYLENPPFPEYTSGHGTVSGAIAIVLSDMFGYNYSFTDHSHEKNGLKPRTFESFLHYANEAALSRLYGGIHYRMSNEKGLENGKRVGRAVCDIKMSKS